MPSPAESPWQSPWQSPGRLARLAYGALWSLLLPVLLLRLWWRGRTLPAFRAHWRERLGWYDGSPAPAPGQPPAGPQSQSRSRAPSNQDLECVWVHAVSLGETQASLPLLLALRARWPQAHLLLTHMTPTGRAAGAQFAIPGLTQCYLPYDAPGAMGRFLDHHRPELGVLMETEVWPGLVIAAQARNCPLVLVNARLSLRSLRGYQRLGRFGRTIFAGLAAVSAQTAADAGRLRTAGADRVEVNGNLKFDAPIAGDETTLSVQFQGWWGARPVWLAASTREGEEALILAAHAAQAAEVLLVLVPRHPQRFAEVGSLIDAHGLSWQPRSRGAAVPPGVRVVLGDSLGELGAYYRSAALAFVGGSLLPLGGQNLLEACARGCPVLIGPHTFNFQQAAEDAVSAGAARRVADSPALADAVRQLLAAPQERVRMAAAGLNFVAQHRGATLRTLALIEAIWASPGAAGATGSAR